MHCEPAVRDGGFDRRAVFLVTATGFSELLIDDGDRQPTGVIGFDRVRQFEQLPLGGLGRMRSSLNFILIAWSQCRWGRRGASRLLASGQT